MKKILVSLFLLVFGLCLAGCETIVEYASLSSITKDEEFTSAYISSVNGDAQVLPVDFDDLKEKEFYKNIMNSSAKPTDVLPEVIPMWSLIIKSDSNQLVIDNLGNLYAEFNDNWYHILCSENDYVALDEFLFPTDSNLTIADLIDTLEFDEVTLKKGDLSLGFVKKFNELKNQSFYNNLMKVTVYSSEETLEKMTMIDVDYYLNFYIKESEEFFSIRIYGVHNISDDYVFCTTQSNVINDLYEFTMTSELFNQIYDYFSGSSKIEVAKFEEIKDIELLSFYNETMVINSVKGFPFIVTTQDIGTTSRLARVHERYNEEFFEHYALMIIAFDTCSTEEIVGINDIKFDGEKFIAIFDVTGVPITDDISTRHFVFKINKLAFQNMDKQSYQVDIKANNLENMGNGSAYYDAYFTPDGDVVNKTSLPHEMPDDFSFTITFGFDGYYDSKTGVLKNGYNYDLSCECETTLKFSEEELKEIYGIFLECSIDRWDEELTVNDNLVKPSYIIDISFTANTETINIRIFGASFIGLNEWNNSVKLGEAYYKIVNEYIKTSEEFQSLPNNQKYYD